MDDKKKIAAALSALRSYMKAEEEAIHKYDNELLSHQVLPGFTHASAKAYNLWRSSGRQAQMQMRALMQLRMFQTSRLE